MADTSNPLSDVLKSYFFQSGPGVNLKLREKIALAQMMQKRAYPKTFGEGLSAIGDALGDRRMAIDLEAQDRAGLSAAAGYTGPDAAPPAGPPLARSYAPSDDAPVVATEPGAATAPQGPFPPGGLRPPEQADPPGGTGLPGSAPYRMPTEAQAQDGRNALPPAPPGILPPQARTVTPPPAPPPQGAPVAIQPPQQAAPPPPLPLPDTAPAPPFGAGGRFDAAFPGQQSSLQPPPGTPVMAAGNEASAEEMADARARMAQAIMQQRAARGGPPPNPTAPGAGSRTSEPAAPVIRQAPPDPAAQIQIQPGAVAGWVPENPRSQPRAQPTIPPSAEELALARDIAIKSQSNPYIAQSPGAIRLQQLQADRAARQKDADKVWEAQLVRETEQAKQHITGRMDQPDRIQKYGTGQLEQETKRLQLEDAREQSILQSRFGGRKPEEVWKEFDTEREGAKKTVHALTQFGVAQDMIKKGVITGTAQGWKVNAAKVAAAFGDKDAGSAIARTEQLQAALKSTLALAVENIQGAGGKVSDTDVRIAEGTIGADPALQLETIKSLVNRGEAAANSKISSYNQTIDTYLGGTRAVDRYRVKPPERQPDPPPQAPIREFRNEADVAAARLPRGTVVRINGRLAETE